MTDSPLAMPATAIISLTDEGKTLAERIIALDSSQASTVQQYLHHHKPKPFAETVVKLFNEGRRLIFICSTGIVVRTLSPHITDKYKDPAVLVLDQQGRHVIPLLSGHEGGANEWARSLANSLDATAVITSAEKYTHPVYTLGIGCDRGCPVEDIELLVEQSLKQLTQKDPELDKTSIQCIASIDLKADEVGLLAFCKKASISLEVFPAEILRTVEDQLSYKSDIVFKEVGCYGVAEAAALLSASAVTGNNAELVLPKQKSKRATCSIARSYASSTERTTTKPNISTL